MFNATIDRLKRNRDSQGLRNLLDKDSVRVRRSAAAALAELGDLQGLSMALSDIDEEVRYIAIQGLKELRGPGVVEAITGWLVSDIPDDVWLSAYEGLKRVDCGPELDVADSWQDCGMTLLKEGKTWRGSQCLWQAVENCGEWNTRIGVVATVFFDHQLYDEAVKACELLLEREPDNVRALGLKGCALTELGKHDAAATTLKQALSIDNDNIDVRKALLATYMGSGDMSSAYALAENTMAVHPGDLRTVVSLIECCIQNGELEKAKSLVAKGYTIQDAGGEERSWLLQEEAMLHAMTGSEDLAVEALQNAIRAYPHEQQHYRLLDALLMIRNFAGGLRGEPQMNRAKLLGLAEKRSRTYMNWAHFKSEWGEFL